MTDIIKLAVYQGYHGQGVPDDVAAEIAGKKPEILCLPEYFFVDPDEESILSSAGRYDFHLQYLVDLSARLNCAIAGGTLLINENGQYKNRCFFVNRAKIAGYYDKIHPFKNEGRGLVKPGYEYKTFIFNGLKIGFLVCADVLYRSSFYNIRGLRPDLIIVPVTSPFKEGETAKEKFSRDKELWGDGARIAGCPIVKAGSVGKIAGRRLQGRSLAASPTGIIFRVMPKDEDKPMLKFIEIHV